MLSLGRFDLDNALNCIHGEEIAFAPTSDNVIDLSSHFASTSAPTTARKVNLSFGL